MWVAHSASHSRTGDLLLTVEGLRVSYGKARVLDGVSLEVRIGEFVVMLGRNGAGKSTTLQAVSALIPKISGSVRFEGKDLTHAKPGVIVRAGLVQVLEGHRVFTTLSVADNLLIGTYAYDRRGDPRALERIYALFPELAERRHQLASRLSGGQQQILAVAQGVIARPRLLMLDEPSAGLAPVIIDRIFEVAAGLCREGVAILLVEQLAEKALRHADWCYVLDSGCIAAAGPAHRMKDHDALRRIYLGTGSATPGATI
ncbi:MAG TPA: ABC transporter ATP-binding protein [Polyangia bacterium]|nr:ABC transporter ATP-binding protein [Polyangia bacterium]